MEDFCGKLIFENETVRRYFISAVLKIPVENISSTKILDPFLRRFHREGKEGILDVLVELWDERKINIEIQVAEIKYWDRRSIFYLSKLYIRGFNRRGNYRNLKSSINISILDFDYLKTASYHTVFRFRDTEGNDYSDALEVHIIELGKLEKAKEGYIQQQIPEIKRRDRNTNDMQDIYSCETINVPVKQDLEVDAYEKEVEGWIAFFRCKTEEEVEELKLQTKNPGIKEAIEELLTINGSTVWRARHEAKLKEKRDHVAREEFLIDKGIEQGIEQSIRSMYTKEKSIQEIASLLDLSEEKVERVIHSHCSSER